MDRRTFLSWAGLGAVATSFPIALAACSSQESASSGDPCAADPCAADPCAADPCAADPCAAAATSGFVAVGSVADLEGGGSIADGKFAGGSGKLIVFKDGENVVALDAKCNHAGCAVNWEGSELVCPCHDSKFAPDGSLISGPATEGLPPFEVKVEGDQVLVKTT